MGNICKNLKKYIFANWQFLSIMAIGIIALSIQMSQVVLYADDYSLGIYSSRPLSEIIQYEINHYLSWGGGYTALLVILLIAAGSFVWKTALVALLAAFVVLSTKIICRNTTKNKWIVASILWLFIFSLSIWVSREVFYWLDGSMAYLFSMFQAFLLFYLLFTRMVCGKNKKYDTVILPLAAFFAGWSSAQSGCISVLIAIGFIIWKRFIAKKQVKIKKIEWATLALCVAGFLIFYFAPGNSGRMATFAEYSNLNLIEKILYRSSDVIDLIIYNYGTDFNAAPIFLYIAAGLLAIVSLKRSSKHRKANLNKMRVASALYSLAIILLCLISRIDLGIPTELATRVFAYTNLFDKYQAGTLSLLHFLPYVAIIIFFFSMAFNAFCISKEDDDPLVFFVILFGLLFQAVMIMAPYNPLRTSFYTTAFMWVVSAKLIVISKHESIDTSPIFIILFMIWNFYFGIIALAIYGVLALISRKEYLNLKDVNMLFVILIFGIFAISNYAKTLYAYHCNKRVNTENISRILEYNNQSSEETVLYLLKPCNEVYGFTGLSGISWVEDAVITYYHLPENLDLKYEGE